MLQPQPIELRESPHLSILTLLHVPRLEIRSTFTMEYDTSKTFREIHATPLALVAELDRIQGFALRRATKLGRGEQSTRLRFLTPLDPQPQDHTLGSVHLRLTSPQEYKETQKYVAVSYTWQQSRSFTEGFSNKIPTYQVQGADGQLGDPKCDPLVIHRAYHFAKTKLKRILIWIDQECTVQDDPEDLEAHLQAMHEIYRRSAYTVVLLTSMISSVQMAAGLFPFMHGGADMFEKLLRSDDCKDRTLCLDALQLLSEDRWFSRTWTYQERFFASVCHYAVPLSPALGATSPDAVLEDWYIPERNLVAFSDKVKTDAPALNKDHFQLDFRPFPLGKGMCTCPMYIMGLLTRLIKFKFEASRSINHKIFLYGFENFGIKSMGISTLNEVKRSSANVSAAELENDLVQGRFETINHVFCDMEACDNAIVADRVSIFANVCQLRWTLATVRLREEKTSYSTCILALLLDELNVRDRGAKMELAEWAGRMNIGEFIRNEGFPFSRSF